MVCRLVQPSFGNFTSKTVNFFQYGCPAYENPVTGQKNTTLVVNPVVTFSIWAGHIIIVKHILNLVYYAFVFLSARTGLDKKMPPGEAGGRKRN